MKTRCFGLSDIGLVRQNNEDAWLLLPECFYALADGMGGHNAGEVAARESLEKLCLSVRNFLSSLVPEKAPLSQLINELKKAIIATNTHVYQLAQKNNNYSGMGTTLCCTLFFDDKVIYAHVGDSRIYRYRQGQITRLTEDHSMMVELKKNTQEQESPYLRNMITRSIGNQPTVEPDISYNQIQSGDLYLLCSDGLSDVISDQMMEKILAEDVPIERSCYQLVELAKQKGSTDNITLVMIKVFL